MKRRAAFHRKNIAGGERPGHKIPSLGHAGSGGESAPMHDQSGEDEGRTVEASERFAGHELSSCPSCGMTFHDQSGAIIPEGHPDHPLAKGDVSRDQDAVAQPMDTGMTDNDNAEHMAGGSY